MAKEKTGRNWLFIGYPGESLPADYADILDELQISWVESPLHDMDREKDGTLKKPHKHFIFTFDGNKSFKQMRELLAPLNGAPPELCNSLRPSVRYLIHRDNPDKAQYELAGIVGHGGFNVDKHFGDDEADHVPVLQQILAWCREEGVTEYCDLVDHVFETGDVDCIRYVTGRYVAFFGQYLRSKGHKREKRVDNSRKSSYNN
jgi:hypothetical protein